MNQIASQLHRTELDMEIIVTEEDNTIYIKLSGFETPEDTDKYADFLQENLGLLLFESEVKH